MPSEPKNIRLVELLAPLCKRGSSAWLQHTTQRHPDGQSSIITLRGTLELMGPSKVTIRYTGDLLDARQTDGKIWFAVNGEAVLTREQAHRHAREEQDQEATGPNITASLLVVPRRSAHGIGLEAEGSSAPVGWSRGHATLLVKAAQTNPAFAPATALPPGIHIMCHVQLQSEQDATGQGAPLGDSKSTAPTSRTGAWSALWQDLREGPVLAEEAERSRWQRPCLGLLLQAAHALDAEAVTSVVQIAPRIGWARVPCEPVRSQLCLLASAAGDTEVRGQVAWVHLDTETAAKAGVALADSLLLTSGENTQPTFASISSRLVGEGGEIDVTAQAHRVWSTGAISGYDLSSARRPERRETEAALDGRTESLRAGVDDAQFVDDSTASNGDDGGWMGTVAMEELPGGGLHRHVRVKIDVGCKGNSCSEQSNGAFITSGDKDDHEWCEVLLSQHVPQGIYIDVDEAKARHDFDVSSSLATRGRVGVETFGGKPIDVELPASVSGQHLVNFNLWLGMPKGHGGGERVASIQAELTVPVHFRYPDPGCDRQGEDCERYAWVEVSPPLASIRCGTEGRRGQFAPVLPSVPPAGIALRVPRGIAWQRNLVAWGTIAAAALGMLYTMYTLLTISAPDSCRYSGQKRRPKSLKSKQ